MPLTLWPHWQALSDPELNAILSRVSRSFYLSLAVMPAALREPLSLAYLLARAADTVADTEAVARPRRLRLLDELHRAARAAAEGRLAEALGFARRLGEELSGPVSVAEERTLLLTLAATLLRFAALHPRDRQRVADVLSTLVQGMVRDLERFDGVQLTALGSLEELDEHCYFAAGCVGQFWTRISADHLPAVRHLDQPAMIERGIRLGKALQLVNVVRDAPGDLAHGRCYLPAGLLAERGLAPADLRHPARRLRARPVVGLLIALALEHLEAARAYVRAIPATSPRLRLACLWPLWIGLDTLEQLLSLEDPLAPGGRRKIDRRALFCIVAESSAAVLSDRLLDAIEGQKVARVRTGLERWRGKA